MGKLSNRDHSHSGLIIMDKCGGATGEKGGHQRFRFPRSGLRGKVPEVPWGGGTAKLASSIRSGTEGKRTSEKRGTWGVKKTGNWKHWGERE